jgi:hypothetical protein
MKLILLLPIIFVLFVPCFAQEIKLAEEKPLVPMNKAINKDGWNIPAGEAKELIYTQTITVGNQPVIQTAYRLKKMFRWQVDLYFLGADNDLNILSLDSETKFVSAYTINGKTFAYAVKCVKAGTNALIEIYYLDEDGDAKFETRYSKLPDRIPNWATESKK